MRSALAGLALAAVLLAPGAALARSEALEDYPARPVLAPSDAPLTLDQVRSAIERGISRGSSGWSVAARTQNTVRARYEKAEHWMIVEFAFTETAYSVKYVDSGHLKYSEEEGTRMIHPNYNRWLRNLLRVVDQELRAPQR